MVDEREVSAKLKITKEGDTGAFKEASADVKELAAQTDASRERLRQFSEGTQEAGESAGEAGESIAGLGGAAGGAAGKLASMVGPAAAVFAAFATGYEMGTKLKGVLNDLTNGGLDRAIQRDADALINFFTDLDETGDAALRLQNGLNILRKNGIDPVGLSAEEVAALVEKLSIANRESAKIADDAAAKYEKQAESLGLFVPALDEASKELVNFARDFERANQDLSEQDLGKIFGPMIQDVLDSYERLGKEAPPRIKVLADGWGVLSTAAQKAAGEQKKIVDEMVADINRAASGLKGSLETQLKTLNEVFSKLNFGDMGAEEIEKAKAFMQQYLDTWRSAGQLIPKNVADHAAALGILVGAYETTSEAVTSFAGAQKESSDESSHSVQVFDRAGKALHGLEAAAATAGKEVKAAGGKVQDGAALVGEGTTPVRDFQKAMDASLASFKDLGKGSSAAGDEVKDGAGKIGEGKKPLEDAGKAAGEAGTGLEAAKKGAEGLGAAGAAAKTAAEGLKTPLEQVKTPAEGAATALTGIQTAATALEGLKFPGFIAALKAVEAQAMATKAAIDAIDGTPAAPSPGGGSSPGGG